jgi:uncharacterized protein (DUF924 family)
MSAMTPPRAQALLDFWFGPPGDPEREQHRQIWFKSTPEHDETLRRLFLADHERAAAGELAAWEDEPESALALVLLLDQIPRNIFRATSRAYDTDAMARAVVDRAIARGFDMRVPPAWRLFFYMPFHHSEDLANGAGRKPAFSGRPGARREPAVWPALCRCHRALRPLPAPERDPRSAIDAGGTRLPRQAQTVFLS